MTSHKATARASLQQAIQNYLEQRNLVIRKSILHEHKALHGDIEENHPSIIFTQEEKYLL